MSVFEPFSGTRPDSQPSPSPDDRSGGTGRFLFARDVDPRQESLRITIGFIALAAVSAVLLNIGIYQSEKSRDRRERWEDLEHGAVHKVEEIRTALGGFRQELQFASERALARRAERPRPEGARLAEMARRRGWRDFELRSPDGVTIERAHPGTPALAPPPAGAMAAVLKRMQPAYALVPGGAGGRALVVAAVPVQEASGVVAIGIAWAELDALFGRSLATWPGFGPSTGAYLVARDAGETVVLSEAPAISGLRAGARQAASTGAFRAAAIAATGAESRLEVKAPERTLWAVTRQIPELGCGLVAQARPTDIAGASSHVLAGLIALDFAVVLLVGAAVVFWRRQYETGLAQRELDVTRRHAQQIQSVFDNAFDAILTFDPGGRLRTANPAAEKIFRRPCPDLYGLSFADLFRFEADAPPAGALATGRVSRASARHPDGLATPVEISVAAAGEGEELLYTAIVRDIGRQVEAEQQIRAIAQGLEVSNRRLAEANAQLEAASRLKSEFLANTSHELRTPLNGMIGFLQLVLDGMCSSPAEEREFQRQALDCSRHLLGLINDVLDIAKIEAGKLTLEIEPVDVRQLFDEVHTITHVQAAQKGIALALDVPEAPATRVRGDFRKVKQILVNLVGNSVKFTPRGRIVVRAFERPDLGHWRFEVEDTGIGIPVERQSTIFEKFIQGDGSTTRRYGGTGLGLAISRSLVELMGGIIGVQSEGEGRGTRMYFTLPVWHAAEEALADDEHGADRIAGPAGGPLVLLVEDDPSFRAFMAALLHRQGYRTVEARHAEAGWMLARRLRPAMVVLDYALACADGALLRTGWDLAERMAEDSKTRHIPLVFVTGFEDEVRARLRQNVFVRKPEHLLKPVEHGQLLATIERMLGGPEDRTIRILMADDDPTVVAYVRKALPERRFHIEVANNGEECLHVLRVQPQGFDLLMLDLMMPGVSGYDVIRQIALEETHRDLPVLVLTNYPEARTDEERQLLANTLVLDVLPKTSVHDNPLILPHIIDWHLQVRGETLERSGTEAAGSRPPSDEPWAEAA